MVRELNVRVGLRQPTGNRSSLALYLRGCNDLNLKKAIVKGMSKHLGGLDPNGVKIIKEATRELLND